MTDKGLKTLLCLFQQYYLKRVKNYPHNLHLKVGIPPPTPTHTHTAPQKTHTMKKSVAESLQDQCRNQKFDHMLERLFFCFAFSHTQISPPHAECLSALESCLLPQTK